MVRALTAHATMALGLLGWWGCAHPKPVGNEVFVGVIGTQPPGMSARWMAVCQRHLDAATWDRWRTAGVPARRLDLVAIGLGDPPRRLASPPDTGEAPCKLAAGWVAAGFDDEVIGMALVRRGLDRGALEPEKCLLDLLPRGVFHDTWGLVVRPLDRSTPDVCAAMGWPPPPDSPHPTADR